MDLNNISISSDKDRIKNLSKTKLIKQNKSINTQSPLPNPPIPNPHNLIKIN